VDGATATQFLPFEIAATYLNNSTAHHVGILIEILLGLNSMAPEALESVLYKKLIALNGTKIRSSCT
jgi:hypothetical protein